MKRMLAMSTGVSVYPGHVVTVVHLLARHVRLMVELAEEVERYHCVHVDDYTGHQHCHCKLGARDSRSGWEGKGEKGGKERREGEEKEKEGESKGDDY